tara:strand:+ start:835 stop:1215 length:381 start_codon:yes stop_codon:yes gene_type:complete
MPTKKSSDSSTGRPVLQWVMAAIGGVVTLGAMGLMIRDAVRDPAPAALSARVIEVQSTDAGQVAIVRVRNDGDDTAANVSLEGVADGQTATATLDYVPGHGQAKAYLRFDAGAQTAVVSVKGWSGP